VEKKMNYCAFNELYQAPACANMPGVSGNARQRRRESTASKRKYNPKALKKY
jgi:hypothetical protein